MEKNPRDLQRLHNVTENFFFWQGLRLVPIGIALMAFAWVLEWHPPGHKAIIWLLLLLGLAVSWLVGDYYTRRYGRVRLRSGQHARRDAIKWLIAYPAIVAALLIDGILKPPLMISGFVFAAATEAYRTSTGGGRRHYIVAAFLLMLAGFLPAFGIVTPGHRSITLLFLLLGAIYAVGGVLDHLELRATLRGGVDEDDAHTV